jgi:hypothetical protein
LTDHFRFLLPDDFRLFVAGSFPGFCCRFVSGFLLPVHFRVFVAGSFPVFFARFISGSYISWKRDGEQCCQMYRYFQTKTLNSGKFWNVGIFYGHFVYLLPNGKFYGDVVLFVVNMYIFPPFGKFYREKSGNPDAESNNKRSRPFWITGTFLTFPWLQFCLFEPSRTGSSACGPASLWTGGLCRSSRRHRNLGPML